jgi:uncharacterized coiled-coil protein SlyX
MATEIHFEQVIARLSQQVGALQVQVVMRDVALEAAEARIAELEGEASPTPAEDDSPHTLSAI